MYYDETSSAFLLEELCWSVDRPQNREGLCYSSSVTIGPQLLYEARRLEPK